jgi:hypothetical protein
MVEPSEASVEFIETEDRVIDCVADLDHVR